MPTPTPPSSNGPSQPQGERSAARATTGSVQHLVENAPSELRASHRWVCWDGRLREDGKLDKTPINPITGGNAQSNNAATWGSFEQACEFALREERVGGLGIVLTNCDYWALDLDHVIDPATGEIAPIVRAFLASITPTYVERSPSGDGLHVIYRGRRPEALTATKAKDALGPGKHLEVFGGTSSRYITMTGRVWDPSSTTTIAEATQDTIDTVLAMFSEAKSSSPPFDKLPSVVLAAEERKARRALQNVPADDYDVWIRVGMALRATFGEAGKPLWIEWSEKSVKYEEKAIDKHWSSFRDKPGGKTIGFVYWLANQHEPGWRQAWQREELLLATSAGPEARVLSSRAARQPLGPEDVLNRWRADGPLIHEPTGIATLDALTGGGPTYGCRVYVPGAPDAGKTALSVQIADTYLQRGIAVGFLAIDEEPGDVLQRFLQRRGWQRPQCERRDHADLDAMAEQMRSLRLRFYDSTWTIEAAAQDLAEFAKSHGSRAAFFIDSIQTARCTAEAASDTASESRYETVTGRVHAVRTITEQHGFITLATSEMNRNAYRSVQHAEKANDMAVSKESGAIEYSARLMLLLRSVAGQSDFVEMRIAKNKLGRRTRDDEAGIFLRLDRSTQVFAEDTTFSLPNEDRHQDKIESKERQKRADAGCVALVLAKQPGLAAKDLESSVIAATPGGMGKGRVAVARAFLRDAIVARPGKRTTVLNYLDGSKVPTQVLVELSIDDWATVASARPPASEPPRGAPSRPRAPGAARSAPRRETRPSPLRGRGASEGARGAERVRQNEKTWARQNGAQPEVRGGA